MTSAAVLTLEEIEALRAHARGLAGPNAAESLDLAAHDRGLRKGLGALTRCLTLFSTRIQGQVSATLRRTCRTVAQPLDIVGPDAASAVLDDLAAAVSLQAPEHGSVGFIGIDSGFAFGLVERAFGAVPAAKPGNADDAAPVRTRLTRLEHETVMPFVTELGVQLSRALAADGSIELASERLSPGFPPELPDTIVSVGLWTANVTSGSVSGNVVLMLLPQMIELAQRNRAVPMTGTQESRLARHLLGADVNVRAVLGHSAISVADLLALRVGDLVRLDAGVSDPVTVLVQDAPKFVAQPLQRGGGLAVTVERVIK